MARGRKCNSEQSLVAYYEDLIYHLGFDGRSSCCPSYLVNSITSYYNKLGYEPKWLPRWVLKKLLYILTDTTIWSNNIVIKKSSIVFHKYHHFGKVYDIEFLRTGAVIKREIKERREEVS